MSPVKKLLPPLVSALFVMGVPQGAAAAFPGGNGDVAFTRNNHIWVVHPNGAQEKLGGGHQPAYSPDGSRIAFVRFPGLRQAHIWVMDADGTDRREVTTGQIFDASPSWSPDGTHLVFSRGRAGFQADIYTVSLQPGSVPAPITDTRGNEFDTEWSPDGTRVAFGVDICDLQTCNLHIGVVDVDGSDYTLLTPDGAVDVDPNWSPDGSAIAFASDRHGAFDGDYDLYAIPAAGGATKRLTRADGAAVNREPVWSPDGTRIAFVHQSSGGAVTIRTELADRTARTRLCRGDPLFYPTVTDWQPLA